MTPEPNKAEEAMGTMFLAAIALVSFGSFCVGAFLAWLVFG